MKYFLFIMMFGCFSQMTLGQTKNEKEVRIALKEFPEKAITVINALPEQCKRIRFYKETDGNKQSFESKFKFKGEHYSLEFNPNGIIEDMEVIMKLKKIDDATKSKILYYFKTSFQKSKLIKIQKQYVYSAEQDPMVFINRIFSKTSAAAVNYELISEVTTESERNIREFTFNSKGDLIGFKTLDPDSYEHALY